MLDKDQQALQELRKLADALAREARDSHIRTRVFFEDHQLQGRSGQGILIDQASKLRRQATELADKIRVFAAGHGVTW